MAKTRNHKLSGVANWARVFEDNRDMNGYEGAYKDHEGGYTIEVVLDNEAMTELQEAGSMKKGKITDDGVSVKFLRKHKDRFEWASGAPEVIKTDGSPWNFEEDGPINNNSLVTVYVSVYDTSRPAIKGTRLDKVRVDRAAERAAERAED